MANIIMAKYSDGYINLPDGQYSIPITGEVRSVGYPSWWLDKTNYKQGPTGYEMK